MPLKTRTEISRNHNSNGIKTSRQRNADNKERDIKGIQQQPPTESKSRLTVPERKLSNVGLDSTIITRPRLRDRISSKDGEKVDKDRLINESQTCNLWVHDENFSKTELVINPEYFPNIKVGDLLYLYHPSKSEETETVIPSRSNSLDHLDKAHDSTMKLDSQIKDNRLIIMVTELDRELLAKQPLLQISISKQIATTFNLKNRSSVLVEKMESSSVAADYIEVSFRDQYLGRNDMWRLKLSLRNSCVYLGKKILYAGCIRVQVKSIYIRDTESACGVITNDTKLIFRSDSARCYILIQMSKEMWQFEEDGFIFNEKAFDGFLPDLTERWRNLATNHVVSIVLFTRVFYTEEEAKIVAVEKLSDGRFYKDYYKVVTDWETRQDWSTVIKELKKREIFYFERDILQVTKDNYTHILGRNSSYKDGCILEALNLALNKFDRHYVDRDLIRTGLCVMMVTPGNGVFQVDKQLLRMTFERMNDNGISLDLVCLSKPPLHIVPLFQFQSSIPPSAVQGGFKVDKLSVTTDHSRSTRMEPYDMKPNESRLEPRQLLYLDDESNDDPKYNYYAVPHWIECSFYGAEKVSYKTTQSVSRCRIPALLNLELQGESKYLFPIPYLDDPISNLENPTSEMIAEECEHYDDQAFTFDSRRPVKVKNHTKTHSLRDIGFKVESRPDHRLASSPSIEPRNHRSNTEELLGHSNDLLASVPLSQSAPRFVGFSESIKDHWPIKGSQLSRPIKEEGKEFMEHDRSHSDQSVKPITIKFKADYLPRHLEAKGSYPESLRSSPGSDYTPQFTKLSMKQNSKLYLDNQVIIDPHHPPKGIQRTANPLGRWRHVYLKDESMYTLGGDGSCKWQSLCQPACLPLTSDEFPSPDELAESYQEYTYTVSPSDEGSEFSGQQASAANSAIGLLKELIAQRLAQGFQLVTSDPTDSTRPLKVVTGFHTTNEDDGLKLHVPQDADNSLGTLPYYLSMGNHLHRLMYDSFGQNVEVKRYVRRLTYPTNLLKYNCGIWTSADSNYCTRNLSFAYPNLNAYNWNYLDHLVSGYQEEMTDGLRFWRARFVLLPCENPPNQLATTINSNANLDEEELRILGFCRFLEQFQKVAVPTNENGKSTPNTPSRQSFESINNLNITFTTLITSTYLRTENRTRRNSTAPTKRSFQFNLRDDKLTKDTKLSTVVQAMLHTSTGVKFSDRRWHLELYENVMVGNELVDWLIRNFNDINTRDEAVKYSNLLLTNNVIQHCRSWHTFIDGHYFYQLTPTYSPNSRPKSNLGWFNKSQRSNLSSQSKDEAESNEIPVFSYNSNEPTHVNQIPLSQAMAIDLDLNRRSDRAEIAFLHYDTLYNVNSCYHFQIHWLGCTSRLIDDLLQSWGRVADKCGLKLVEGPVAQTTIFSNENPFRVPTQIIYAVPPPPLQDIIFNFNTANLSNSVPDDLLSIMLLKKFDFILDIESDSRLQNPQIRPIYSYHKTKFERTQLLHRSGAVLVQILPEGRGLLLELNRLLHSKENRNSIPTSITTDVRVQLQQFCSDIDALQQFWNESCAQLTSRKGIENVADALTDDVIGWVINNSNEKEKDGELTSNHLTTALPIHSPANSLLGKEKFSPPDLGTGSHLGLITTSPQSPTKPQV